MVTGPAERAKFDLCRQEMSEKLAKQCVSSERIHLPPDRIGETVKAIGAD